MILLLGCVAGDVFYVRSGEADLYVELSGPTDRAIVLLLHGGPGGGSQAYELGTWDSRITERYAIAFHDQRGTGRSQGAFDLDELTISQHVADVEAVADVLAALHPDTPLVAMGHSWGGLLGTAWLLDGRGHEQLDGWIEVDGAHDLPLTMQSCADMLVDEGEVRDEAFWDGAVEEARSYGGVEDTLGASSVNRLCQQAELYVDEIEPLDELDRGDLGAVVGTIPGLWQALVVSNAMFEEVLVADYSPRLRELTVPTLLVWGAWDFTVPTTLYDQALAGVGAEDLTGQVLERSGHSPMLNQPAEFAGTVLGWLDERF